LATITLLAAAGVFLYMKINETEPELPAGVSEWSPDSFEIGDGTEGGLATGLPAALPGATPDLGAAPAYAPSAPKTPTGAAPIDDSAPAWAPGPLAIAEPKPPAPAPPADESSPVARTAETPAAAVVPEVPPLPDVGSTTATTPVGATSAPAPAPVDAPRSAEPTPAASTQPSMFAAARVAAQGALDRGELAQALLLLSEWYGDPSLSAAETKEVENLLSQLAGSVIYEGPPAHRLERAYIVQAGETLETIAAKYDVPWQLLAKINDVASPNALQPGQELKVVRGPFSALVEISKRRMTLMLDRRYAGKFAIELDPTTSIEEGQWKVDQKLLTPATATPYGAPDQGPTEDRSLLLANLTNPSGPPAVVRGPGATDPVTSEPKGRTIRMKGADVEDIFDILSEGSRVTIRR